MLDQFKVLDKLNEFSKELDVATITCIVEIDHDGDLKQIANNMNIGPNIEMVQYDTMLKTNDKRIINRLKK